MSTRLKAIVGTSVLVLATVVLVMLVYELPADFSLPLVYSGDALEWLVVIQGSVTGQGLSHSFAPFEVSVETPLIVSVLGVITMPLWLSLVHFFYVVTGEVTAAVNWYFYTGYVLTNLSMLALLRYFRVDWAWAVAVSVIFSFLPFHQFRSVFHLLDASYFLVPLYVLIVLWLLERSPLFFRQGRFSLRGRKSLVTLVTVLWAGPSSAYFAFFAAMFAAIAGVMAWARFRNLQHLISAVIVVSLLGLSLVKTSWPQTLHKAIDPNFAEALGQVKPGQPLSSYGQAEEFGLKVVQLVLPVNGHRIEALADMKAFYNEHNPLVNENHTASLGIVGALAFLGLLLVPFMSANRRGVLNNLALLSIAGVLIGSVGGFSSLAALFSNWLTPGSQLTEVRSYNRISVFIACMSLLAFVLVMSLKTRSLNSYGNAAIAGIVTVIALLDMVPGTRGQHQLYSPYFLKDQAFFTSLEQSLEDKARVLQVPLAVHHQTYNYQEAYVPQLHTSGIVWSFGADVQSEQMNWYRQTLQLTGCDLKTRLVEFRFSGVLLDRALAGDKQAEYNTQLNCLSPRFESEDRRFVFYSLK